MERREAGTLVVGIGSCFEQGSRQLEMAVLDGQDRAAVPRAGPRPAGLFVCMASLTSAPAFSKTRTTSVRPSRTANRMA